MPDSTTRFDMNYEPLDDLHAVLPESESDESSDRAECVLMRLQQARREAERTRRPEASFPVVERRKSPRDPARMASSKLDFSRFHGWREQATVNARPSCLRTGNILGILSSAERDEAYCEQGDTSLYLEDIEKCLPVSMERPPVEPLSSPPEEEINCLDYDEADFEAGLPLERDAPGHGLRDASPAPQEGASETPSPLCHSWVGFFSETRMERQQVVARLARVGMAEATARVAADLAIARARDEALEPRVRLLEALHAASRKQDGYEGVLLDFETMIRFRSSHEALDDCSRPYLALLQVLAGRGQAQETATTWALLQEGRRLGLLEGATMYSLITRFVEQFVRTGDAGKARQVLVESVVPTMRLPVASSF